jgi:hypothetical protein
LFPDSLLATFQGFKLIYLKKPTELREVIQTLFELDVSVHIEARMSYLEQILRSHLTEPKQVEARQAVIDLKIDNMVRSISKFRLHTQVLVGKDKSVVSAQICIFLGMVIDLFRQETVVIKAELVISQVTYLFFEICQHKNEVIYKTLKFRARLFKFTRDEILRISLVLPNFV